MPRVSSPRRPSLAARSLRYLLGAVVTLPFALPAPTFAQAPVTLFQQAPPASFNTWNGYAMTSYQIAANRAGYTAYNSFGNLSDVSRVTSIEFYIATTAFNNNVPPPPNPANWQLQHTAVNSIFGPLPAANAFTTYSLSNVASSFIQPTFISGTAYGIYRITADIVGATPLTINALAQANQENFLGLEQRDNAFATYSYWIFGNTSSAGGSTNRTFARDVATGQVFSASAAPAFTLRGNLAKQWQGTSAGSWNASRWTGNGSSPTAAYIAEIPAGTGRVDFNVISNATPPPALVAGLEVGGTLRLAPGSTLSVANEIRTTGTGVIQNLGRLYGGRYVGNVSVEFAGTGSNGTLENPVVTAGSMLSLTPGDFGGGAFDSAASVIGLQNAGTVVVRGNGAARMNATFSGNLSQLGAIRADGALATATIGKTAFLAGTLEEDAGNSTTLTASDIAQVRAVNGGTIALAGNFQNAGQTLDLTTYVGAGGANGNLLLAGVAIRGGTISNSQHLQIRSATLDGVRLTGTGLTVGSPNSAGRVQVVNGLTYDPGFHFRIGVTNGTYLGELSFRDSATLDNARVTLIGGGDNSGGLVFNRFGTGGSQTLTLGPNLLVDAEGRGKIGNSAQGYFPGENDTRTLVNQGTIRASGGNDLQILGSVKTGDAYTLQNSGTIEAVGADSRVEILPNWTSATNTGTMRASGGGRLGVWLNDNGASPALMNSGTIEVGAGSSLLSYSEIQQTAGLTRVNGTATFSVYGEARLILDGGLLTGTGTIAAVGPVAVENRGGTVSPGNSPGTLTIDGYTQGAGGTLLIEIAGALTGEYDVLNVTGDAQLGGTLQVALLGGYVPESGATFSFLNVSGATLGGFSQIQSLTPGFSFDFGPGGQLIARAGGSAAAPEPGSLALLLVVGGALTAAVRRPRR